MTVRRAPVELFLTAGEARVLLRAVEGVIRDVEARPYVPGTVLAQQERVHLDDLRRYLTEALAEELGK